MHPEIRVTSPVMPPWPTFVNFHDSKLPIRWAAWKKRKKNAPATGIFIRLSQFFQIFQRLAGLVDSTKVIDPLLRFDQIVGRQGL